MIFIKYFLIIHFVIVTIFLYHNIRYDIDTIDSTLAILGATFVPLIGTIWFIGHIYNIRDAYKAGKIDKRKINEIDGSDNTTDNDRLKVKIKNIVNTLSGLYFDIGSWNDDILDRDLDDMIDKMYAYNNQDYARLFIDVSKISVHNQDISKAFSLYNHMINTLNSIVNEFDKDLINNEEVESKILRIIISYRKKIRKIISEETKKREMQREKLRKKKEEALKATLDEYLETVENME